MLATSLSSYESSSLASLALSSELQRGAFSLVQRKQHRALGALGTLGSLSIKIGDGEWGARGALGADRVAG